LKAEGDIKKENKMVKHNGIKAEVKNLNFYYGTKQALKNISLTIPEKKVFYEWACIYWALQV